MSDNCGECTFGRFGAVALASVGGCSSAATKALIAGVTRCNDVTHPDVTAKYLECKDALNVIDSVPQCLLHAGPSSYVTLLFAAFLYASLLPLLILFRPSVAVKCD